MNRPTTWLAVVAVVATTTGGITAARADDKNEIRAVTYSEDAGTTRIHVRGAQTPTFTVYKLERPSRVVIDVPRARLAEALRGHEGASVLTANTWAVSSIAAQQLDDGGQLVRVIVSLARPGRYDVKTQGNEVVILVTSRDAAPAGASPEALAAAQAEAAKAKAEAERLRTAAAQTLARAEAAEKAANANGASSAELAKAKAAAEAARAEATKAKAAAQTAQADADKKRDAAEQARASAEAGRKQAVADADRARQEAAAAKQDLVKSRAEAEAAKAAAARQAEAAAETRAQAEAAKQAAARDAEAASNALAEAATMKANALRDAETAKAAAAKDAAAAKAAAAKEATAAKQASARDAEAVRQAAARDAELARKDLDRTKAEAAAALRDAERARKEAATAQAAAAKQLALANAAKAEADRARREAETARSYAAQQDDAISSAKAEAARAKTDAQSARTEAEAARAAAETLRAAAAADKQQAETARKQAEAARTAAERDRKQAEAARTAAERTSRDAKQQLAALDQKMQAAQALEDKARATSAAAQAREEAAREAAQQASRERVAAEAAAKAASNRAAASSTDAASERAKLEADAKAAEQRLAAARRATEDAETRRREAEQAALAARDQLAKSRTTLATVEQQRAAAETAAEAAARKRGEAEAAAGEAARRRTEAETAVADARSKRQEAEAAAKLATDRRGEAEAQRLRAEQDRRAAETAASAAKAAAAAAEQQRTVAETAAKTASDRRRAAEASLAELTTRRQSAERAAAELETRSKAEAKAQAEVAAATARKASDAELARARAEATRLAEQRAEAESELADRRKAVAAQQAEAARLASAATQARDAATREETRRTELAALRVKEEQELARIKQQRAVAQSAPAAPAKAKAAPIAHVNDIAFAGSTGNGQISIQIAGDSTVTVGEVTATHAELIIDNADIAAKLEKKLDVSRFGSPVRAVSSFRDRKTPGRVRLIAELAIPTTPTFHRDAGGVQWRFASADAPARAVAKAPPRTSSVPSPVVGGFGAASTPITQQSVSQVPAQGNGRRRVYRGATVDIDFKNAPIHDLLRILADTGRVNIVIPESIDPRVTVRLKRVPWDQALEVILASQGLWYRREGNLYRVAPRAELDKEDEAEAARRAAMIKAEVPRPEVIALNYASAAELKAKLEPMLSGAPGAALQVDERTNALIINDVAGNRAQIAQLALRLDTQTPQISIEARIVEARSTFARQFGIQWGGRALAGGAGGNATGLIFPSSIGIIGGNEDAQTNRNGVATPSDFAVNLPAATGSGAGGAIGLSLGSVGGNLNINLRLSALEDSGTVRIISAPKITVLNNKQAKISQGVSIPISVISAAGTQTQFVQADLSLEVTPYVSQRDCAIAMNLVVTKNEPDFVNVGARGDPSILRKEARTSMLVNDGETSVLGGIYTRNTGLAYSKIPFLGDLPVLGWLFKNRRENDDRTEILVFITPKITNKALLRCQ